MLCVTGVYIRDIANTIFVILHLNESCLNVCSFVSVLKQKTKALPYKGISQWKGDLKVSGSRCTLVLFFEMGKCISLPQLQSSSLVTDSTLFNPVLRKMMAKQVLQMEVHSRWWGSNSSKSDDNMPWDFSCKFWAVSYHRISLNNRAGRFQGCEGKVGW